MTKQGSIALPGSVDSVLVVDLDHALLRTDLGHEGVWSGLSQGWRSALVTLGAVAGGRTALHAHLAGNAAPDPATLPCDRTVIAYVEAWRARGGRTALVTAHDPQNASAIAEHLGLFDDVLAPVDGSLQGAARAAFLSERYGAGGYAYLGRSPDDLPAWRNAGRAITVNAAEALRKRIARENDAVEHLDTRPPAVPAYTKALRPHQWLKNTLVFLPMLAAHAFDGQTILRSLAAFAAFSFLASGVYVLNDLVDLQADRRHPRKRDRPFASGAVPIVHGTWMAVGALLGGLATGAFLGPFFVVVLLGYLATTLVYSVDLKRRVVIDICVLAGLYTLRIIAGGAATGITVSVWLLAFGIFFFLSLAAIKRQAELVDSLQRGTLTASGRGYHVDDLPLVSQMAVSAGYVSVLVMALYINSPAVAELYTYPSALFGACLVLLYWISRMAMVAHRGGMHDDPIIYAARDRISQVCLLLVVGFATAGSVL